MPQTHVFPAFNLLDADSRCQSACLFCRLFEKWAAALPRPCAHFSKSLQKGKLLGNVSHGIVLYSKLGYFKAQCSRHGGGYWILFFAFSLHMLHGHDFQTLLLSLRTQNPYYLLLDFGNVQKSGCCTPKTYV